MHSKLKPLRVMKILKIILLLISISSILNASDSNKINLNWDIEFWGVGEYNEDRKPALDISYFNTNPIIQPSNYNNNFSSSNNFMVRLHRVKHMQSVANTDVIKNNTSGLIFYHNLSNLEKSTEEIQTVNTALGLFSESGLGYALSDDIQLYFNNAAFMMWNGIKFSDNFKELEDELLSNRLQIFHNTVRFSTGYSPSIKLRMHENFSFNAAFSENVIYPRIQTWYFILSHFSEFVGHQIINQFVDEILRSSPYFAPIVNFALLSAMKYGFARLRENNMNWPISGAPPFIDRGFSFGFSIIM